MEELLTFYTPIRASYDYFIPVSNAKILDTRYGWSEHNGPTAKMTSGEACKTHML